MPNTLVHLGLQTLISKSVFRPAEFRWIALGLLIPDLPWILQRIVAVTGMIDPLALRTYSMIQASLLFSLILALAISLLSQRPRAIFPILAANCLLHLLLDASETKWGNGIHLLAPFSWQLQQWGFFWPESLTLRLLTCLGFAAGLWFSWQERNHALLLRLNRRTLAGAVLLAACYFLLPFACFQGPQRTDSHAIATLADRESRPGRAIAIDRGRFDDQTGQLVIFSGERFTLTGQLPKTEATISLQGRFLDAHRIEVLKLHIHDRLRDWASLFGVAVIVGTWLFALVKKTGMLHGQKRTLQT